MGNLPIPSPALGSTDAAEDDEQRLSGAPRGDLGALETVMPAGEFLLCEEGRSDEAERGGQKDGTSGGRHSYSLGGYNEELQIANCKLQIEQSAPA
jgi:hypothetical protein